MSGLASHALISTFDQFEENVVSDASASSDEFFNINFGDNPSPVVNLKLDNKSFVIEENMPGIGKEELGSFSQSISV